MLLMRLIGGAIGFFLGELAAVVPFALLEYPLTSLWEWESGHGIAALPVPNMVILAGGSIGAAAGTRFFQESLGEDGSYRSALLWALASLPAGSILAVGLLQLSNHFGMDWWRQSAEQSVAQMITSVTIVAGAVIGSGCKAKPANLGTKKGVPPALD